MFNFKSLLNKYGDYKKISFGAKGWLEKNEYISNKELGWERKDVLMMFGIKESEWARWKGVPHTLQDVYEEAEGKDFSKDEFGNKVCSPNKTKWVKAEKKDYRPDKRYLELIKWRKSRDEQSLAKSYNEPPLEVYENI